MTGTITERVALVLSRHRLTSRVVDPNDLRAACSCDETAPPAVEGTYFSAHYWHEGHLAVVLAEAGLLADA